MGSSPPRKGPKYLLAGPGHTADARTLPYHVPVLQFVHVTTVALLAPKAGI
jgi:hypothetical protein